MIEKLKDSQKSHGLKENVKTSIFEGLTEKEKTALRFSFNSGFRL